MLSQMNPWALQSLFELSFKIRFGSLHFPLPYRF